MNPPDWVSDWTDTVEKFEAAGTSPHDTATYTPPPTDLNFVYRGERLMTIEMGVRVLVDDQGRRWALYPITGYSIDTAPVATD